ncbi:hypothetical protein [Chitinophaga ginsengisoli]|uniref:Uncharacterized protein n=1 Tax=Chitinophaga ginsengisoli TaxID=363837 RepID=A0A2P8FXL8_9BACT|nr:hypothetical protein [Chitinophaga ginsengisoli]PSL26451.1 hypothetical protein CLV42_111165 [Chitinophaga ginsengisoli]
MTREGIKTAWITGICAIISATITGIIQNGCNNSKSQEKEPVHQDSDLGSNYNAGRDNIESGSGSTVFTANDSSKVNITINPVATEKMKINNVKPTQSIVNDQTVTSYNQSGGITAKEVTVNVPTEEDLSDIDMPNNFITDTSTVDGYFVFKVRPKVGKWDSTFIAFPYKEKDEVSANFSNGKIVMAGTLEGSMPIILNEKIDPYYFFLCYGEQATPRDGFMISCKKRPSIIIFGSMTKKNKQYVFPITSM